MTRFDRCNEILVWLFYGRIRVQSRCKSLISGDEAIITAMTEENRSLLGCKLTNGLSALLNAVTITAVRLV